MPIDWKPLVELVQRHQKFLLTTHVRPDPDGLGSQLALADVLRSSGKEVQMVIASVYPPRYSFMDPEKRIVRYQSPGDEFRKAEAIIVLDTGTWNQLGDFGEFIKTSPAAKLVIDHHLSQDDLGGIALVDTTAEATGRLVYEAAQALGVAVSEAAANHLFAALATDTGWFRHGNTKPETFALAQALMEAGARPTYLYEMIYEQNTLPRLRLTGLVLERLQVLAGGQISYTEVRSTDYAQTGAVPQDTEDMINFCRSLAGVEVAAFFMEQPAGGVKVSFRARSRVNVAAVAEQFGGGGHRLAAGAIVNDSLENARATVLQALTDALEKSTGPVTD
jgi:phosphoesterase RecJ-like protein